MPGSNLLGVCSECCGGGSGITWTCESVQGSGTLRGFSKYQNENSGDWNRRKALTEDVSGTFSETTYGPPDCTTSEDLPCATTISTEVLTGFSINPTTNVRTNGTAIYSTAYSLEDCGDSFSEMDEYSVYLALRLPAVTVISEDVATWARCSGCVPFEDVSSKFCAGVITHTRSNFDTVADAIVRGMSTPGTSCETWAGTIGSTTVGSTTQIAFTATTASKALISLPITTPGTYTFTVDLQPKLIDGTLLTAEEEDITIAVSSGDIVGGRVEYPYTVPVRDSRRVQFVGARDLVGI